MLHIFEGPMTTVSGQNYESMFSCMWNVIITLSTVGYGELYPKTFFGRIVGVIICFWGVFILSLFVVTITNSLEFSSNEDKAFSLLMKLLYKKKLKIEAVELIQKAYSYKMVKKNEPKNIKGILSKFKNFRQQTLNFQNIIQLLRGQDEKELNSEIENTIQFTEALIGQLEKMKEVQDQIEDAIIEVLEQIRDRELRKCKDIEETLQLENRLVHLNESLETKELSGSSGSEATSSDSGNSMGDMETKIHPI